MYFYKNSLKIVTLILFLLVPFCSIFGVHTAKKSIDKQRVERRTLDRKLNRKTKKVKKKIRQIETEQEKGKSISPLLFFGLLLLIIGIALIISAGGAGLIGILRLIFGVPIAVGGLVLLIVNSLKNKP